MKLELLNMWDEKEIISRSFSILFQDLFITYKNVTSVICFRFFETKQFFLTSLMSNNPKIFQRILAIFELTNEIKLSVEKSKCKLQKQTFQK